MLVFFRLNRVKPFLRVCPVLLPVAFGSFFTSMDASGVVAMLPLIRQSNGIGGAEAGLIVVAELVTTAGLLLTCGRLGDQFGHKRAYLTGLGVFALGSALGLMASSVAALVLT